MPLDSRDGKLRPIKYAFHGSSKSVRGDVRRRGRSDERQELQSLTIRVMHCVL
jgi:hypothetical protein